jgi:hypothetical protein
MKTEGINPFICCPVVCIDCNRNYSIIGLDTCPPTDIGLILVLDVVPVFQPDTTFLNCAFFLFGGSLLFDSSCYTVRNFCRQKSLASKSYRLYFVHTIKCFGPYETCIIIASTRYYNKICHTTVPYH